MTTIESEAIKNGRLILKSTADYSEWAQSLRGWLLAIEAWHYVGEGETEEGPEDSKYEAEKKANVEKLRRKKARLVGRAISMILEGIAPNQRQHIRDLEDPKEMWKVLKSVHTRPDRQKLMSPVRAITSPQTLKDKSIEERASTLQHLNRGNERQNEAGRRLPGNAAIQQPTRRIRDSNRNNSKQRSLQDTR